LAAAAEVPLLEPLAADGAREVMRRAFELSARHRLPVVVRITRALANGPAGPRPSGPDRPARRPATFRRQPERLNVLPIHVVEFHRRLQAAVAEVQAEFEASDLNERRGHGRRGIIVAGQAYEKLREVLDAMDGRSPPVLALSTLYPLPQARIAGFVHELEGLLILEETAPYVEIGVQALAQRAGLCLPVYGRRSGHMPGSGELFAGEITDALASLWPDVAWPDPGPGGRPMPSRQPLCDDCPYLPTLETLLAVMERQGGREAFVVTGETGCMVRAQLPPWQIMDLKYGMGASIGLAAGLARAGIRQKVVALSGDSAFLHSGLGELIDAAQAGADLLVLLLANEITALSGGQPHPATAHDTRGRPRRPVDLAALVRASGVPNVRVVDPEDGAALEAALEHGLASEGPAVVVVRRACPQWPDKQTDWRV
jgi:indolepyruvate ferredoxin oxidoreductase alpha subunit